jgi:subfamily B ATP-binding cassette protein MsbA
MIYTPIRQISSVYNNFQDALAANSRLHELFNLEPAIKSGAIATMPTVEKIVLDAISLNYGDKKALDSINLTINRGETVALVGESGAGKSSLIGLITRFFDPSSGVVFLNNTNTKELSLQALRDKIAFVTQRIYILNDSVAANVAYGEEFPDLLKVEAALKSAHAYDFVSKLPKQEYTILGEFGATLSGGQRQRIAIARAIYKNPEILIFDEATAALDNESERAVMSAISELRENRIVILIAHRMSSIKIAKKIVVMSKGKIVCFGSENELLEKCPEFQRLQTDDSAL